MRLERRLACLLPLLSLASLAGCATPAPIVRLYPRGDDDVIWVGGRAVVVDEQQGVRVAAAFDHQTPTMVGFRVEVENQTGAPVDVTPSKMIFVTCRAEKTCSRRTRVVDPEEALDALDANRSREQAAAANDAVAGATLMFLSVVGGASDMAATAAETEGVAARHDRAAAGIEADRQTWSTLALRRTTLMPGRGVAGHVYIPIDPDAHLVWLQVEIEGRRFRFCFRQHTKSVG